MWVSFSVTVEGIERILFVLPRERRVEQDDDGNIHETEVVPKPEDVHGDFDMIRKIKSCRPSSSSGITLLEKRMYREEKANGERWFMVFMVSMCSLRINVFDRARHPYVCFK